jgi:hypothetical protein
MFSERRHQCRKAYHEIITQSHRSMLFICAAPQPGYERLTMWARGVLRYPDVYSDAGAAASAVTSHEVEPKPQKPVHKSCPSSLSVVIPMRSFQIRCLRYPGRDAQAHVLPWRRQGHLCLVTGLPSGTWPLKSSKTRRWACRRGSPTGTALTRPRWLGSAFQGGERRHEWGLHREARPLH